MRPSEYLSGDWQVKGKRVSVHGHKTGGAERVVPLVHPLVAPGHQYKKFREALQAIASDVTPRTARKGPWSHSWMPTDRPCARVSGRHRSGCSRWARDKRTRVGRRYQIR